MTVNFHVKIIFSSRIKFLLAHKEIAHHQEKSFPSKSVRIWNAAIVIYRCLAVGDVDKITYKITATNY